MKTKKQIQQRLEELKELEDKYKDRYYSWKYRRVQLEINVLNWVKR